MRALLARFRAAREGSIAVMSTLSGACVVGCLALAVDVGSLHLERRQLQSVADLAAVAAAGNRSNAAAAAAEILAANGVTASIQVEQGAFTPDAALEPAARFSVGGAAPNAVRVTLSKPGALYFARVIYGGSAPVIRVKATAAERNVAQFSIGSRLASLNGGMLNEILGDLLGTNVSLSVMDYNGLVAADLDLLDFMHALAGEIGIAAGTYDSVLKADMTLGDVLNAAAEVAGGQGAAAAQMALNRLRPGVSTLALDGTKLLGLGEMGGLSIGERPSGLSGSNVLTKISALDLVRAAVNAAGPNNQAEISLTGGLSGVASAKIMVTIGEPPQGTSWIEVGAEGAGVYTAQTRVRLVATLLPAKIVLTHVASLEVPLALDIAAGRARLKTISCGADPATDARVELAVRPAIGGIHIGKPKNLANWNSFRPPDIEPADVVSLLGVLKVGVGATALVSNTADISQWFGTADIRDRVIKTVKTTTPLTSLISSLFSGLTVKASALGLEILVGGLLAPAEVAVRGLVSPLGAVLEPVLQSLLNALGVGLGEADMRVHGVRCGAPALVM